MLAQSVEKLRAVGLRVDRLKFEALDESLFFSVLLPWV
jgi:hypothetical protein